MKIQFAKLMAVIAFAVGLQSFASAAKKPSLSVGTPGEISGGYKCHRRENFPDGYVYADGYPNRNGELTSLFQGWELKSGGLRQPELKLIWTEGPFAAVPPPGFFNASITVFPLPPLGSQLFLRLSSGETIQRDFIDKKTWREWNKSESSGYGSFVESHTLEFMKAFENAQWADIDLIDPKGANLAHSRVDLSKLSEQLTTMRRLGDEVRAIAPDYLKSCGEIRIIID